MNFIIAFGFAGILLAASVYSATISMHDGESSVHFGFKTDNGQSRTEDIKYNNTINIVDDDKDSDVVKPVEYRGGYSFISADGYEYTVLYKANKNGFHPYVTAKKIQNFNKESI